jgi:hypothetical protein
MPITGMAAMTTIQAMRDAGYCGARNRPRRRHESAGQSLDPCRPEENENILSRVRLNKIRLPWDIPHAGWSFIRCDDQCRPMLQTPHTFPRFGSETYLSRAA